MSHRLFVVIMLCVVALDLLGREADVVIADSVSRRPLGSASVFDRKGRFVGVSNANGRIPYVAAEDYPLTVRYMGYDEKLITKATRDTIFLQENVMELSEVIVETHNQKVLHILAYMREYSTLSTYSDTITLFREKMVDYMLPTNQKSKLRGWRTPRVIASQSYYQFTNASGLDSVSDHCNQHFSWSDWIAIPPEAEIPAVDTIMGKYSPTEIWTKGRERVVLDVNVLADTASRKWVPNLTRFFRDSDEIDFEQFRMRFTYNNLGESTISPVDMTGYSFNIESRGRGTGIFLFNRSNEPFFVSTYAEVYIIDKEYITLKEAKKWVKLNAMDDISIMEPENAPELQPAVKELIGRVNSLDRNQVRLGLTPDQRLVGRTVKKVNAGELVLKRIKGIFGIDHIIGRHKREKEWKEFRREQRERND